MAYRILSQDEQDEIIVQTHLAQERDHFCHTKNVERYQAMLASLPAVPPEVATQAQAPTDTFHVRMAKLLVTEQAALDQVTTIMDKTAPQLPPQARIDAARTRIRARETTIR